MQFNDLEGKTLVELYQMAREKDIVGYSKLRKKELIFEILKHETKKDGQLH
ncbi:MAG: Rho termination factor N-terminal domain-containing protein, partial [Clostridia bacterium]|nr:Rho termination factor N-terminal domain-containing protein [Clostridia bacterium]